MKKNLGLADRIIRVLVAIVVAVLYFTGMISGTVALILGAIAIIFLLTSVISFCPIYAVFGIRTCKVKE